MKIDQLIDRDYFAVSGLEDIHEVYDLLKERPCYVVLDEEMEVIGIVTLKDIPFCSNAVLGEQNLEKPPLTPGCSIAKALDLMQSSGNNFLPVYQGSYFIGTISVFSITEYLLKKIPSSTKTL